MSERKSWDIAPRKALPSRTPAAAPQRRAAAPAARAGVPRATSHEPRPPLPKKAPAARQAPAAARAVPVRRTPAGSPANTGASRPAPRRAAPPSKGRLRDRRQRARKAVGITAASVLAILLIGGFIALWLPQLRVQEVSASGPNADRIEAAAKEQLAGTYAFVVPRDSIFFLPKEAMQDAVLAQVPEAADISISRSSFTTLEIAAASRTKAFVWCGVAVDRPMPDGSCYEADSGGLIYARIGGAAESVAAGTTVITDTANADDAATTPSAGVAPSVSAPGALQNGDLLVYSALDRELGEGQSPIGARVVRAASMPDALRFVEAVEFLNVPVVSLVLRDDEADLWVNDSTRITYVIGREESAAQLAASVIPKLDLLDGTIQYLDLRFNGKAYLKRYGE